MVDLVGDKIKKVKQKKRACMHEIENFPSNNRMRMSISINTTTKFIIYWILYKKKYVFKGGSN